MRKFFYLVPSIALIATFSVQAEQCDPNYQYACVPLNVSDVDCETGIGDGPQKVRGPFKVIGTDHHDLDRDKDGIACEINQQIGQRYPLTWSTS
ncbi:MAG: excalibur calcium-binding domain-containing protein [Amylibacter sp.]|nr:excalibur calcium-binding domain-containing protein [Amylibacter sp.]